MKGLPLEPSDLTMTFFTDASLSWWGTIMEGRTASGDWLQPLRL